MNDELVDVLDDNSTIVNRVLKSEAHQTGALHATVIGYLRYDEDWALIRQAADRQDAGQLVAPVGGHVKSGERYADALLREAEEEIGTRNIQYTLIGQATFRRHVIGRDENHLFIVFEISTTDDIVLGEEADSIERFTSDKLKHALHSTPEEFGAAYYFILEHFYADYLPDTYQFRWKIQ